MIKDLIEYVTSYLYRVEKNGNENDNKDNNISNKQNDKIQENFLFMNKGWAVLNGSNDEIDKENFDLQNEKNINQNSVENITKNKKKNKKKKAKKELNKVGSNDVIDLEKVIDLKTENDERTLLEKMEKKEQNEKKLKEWKEYMNSFFKLEQKNKKNEHHIKNTLNKGDGKKNRYTILQPKRKQS